MRNLGKVIGEYGQGYLEMRGGVMALHLKGAPYERGFQHGYLLSSQITETATKGLTGAAAVTAHNMGCSLEEGFAKLVHGKEEAQGFIPPEFKEEMQGIADALAKAGSPLTLDDVILWNTMYDSWCFFSHPNLADPAAVWERQPYAVGCSSFSAWGDATRDGALVFGKNMDNLDLPGTLAGRVLVICDPDNGFGHANVTHPGMIGIDGGLNEDGVEMMTQYSPSIYESMRGCGIAILSRLILQTAHTVEDAQNVLTVYPRCTGINYHVADAKLNKAIVVEANARDAAVRRPYKRNILWTTNHYNCYPGWMGYQGINMVEGQKTVYPLKDVSTIDAWQQSLRDKTNHYFSATGRFRQYEKLLNESYGNISVENGIEILTDRHHPDTGEVRDWDTPAKAMNDGVTISFWLAPTTFASKAKIYKSGVETTISGRNGNLWSMIATPATGDFRVAMSDFPAHRGPYVHFNLHEELDR
jgi:hypothetical protein